MTQLYGGEQMKSSQNRT